jgi:hypothetical protein
LAACGEQVLHSEALVYREMQLIRQHNGRESTIRMEFGRNSASGLPAMIAKVTDLLLFKSWSTSIRIAMIEKCYLAHGLGKPVSTTNQYENVIGSFHSARC